MINGLILLAFGLVLRHAVDADHIAAIDNTTRKLTAEGQKPLFVGFFFALGHSAVVILLSAAIAMSSSLAQSLPLLKETGSIIGLSISSVFLILVGLINLSALKDIKGGAPNGFMSKLLKPLSKIVTESSQMFYIGFLFGLGFDTATEIGLLSISAATAISGIPFWEIMLLPLAFTVGMTVIDTLDGILMHRAYNWAYINPTRKLYYNLGITLLSAGVALSIGIKELLEVINRVL